MWQISFVFFIEIVYNNQNGFTIHRIGKSGSFDLFIGILIVNKLDRISGVNITNIGKIIEFECENKHFKLDLIQKREKKVK